MISKTNLNKSGKSGHCCCVFDFRGKPFTFFGMMLAVVLLMLSSRYSHFVKSLPHKWMLHFVKYFSCIIESLFFLLLFSSTCIRVSLVACLDSFLFIFCLSAIGLCFPCGVLYILFSVDKFDYILNLYMFIPSTKFYVFHATFYIFLSYMFFSY